MVPFFYEGGGPYLKGEKPPTPSSISNTGLIDGVSPLSANESLRFIRIWPAIDRAGVQFGPPSTAQEEKKIERRRNERW